MWKWEAEGQPKAVVVIIHSAYEHHNKYAWLIQKLRSQQFHVVTGDLPGHGEQGRRNVHQEPFTHYQEFVDSLLKVGLDYGLPLFVIGHGFGATLMIRALQVQSIECAGVILSCPWLELIHQPPKFSPVLSKISANMKIDHQVNLKILTRNYDYYVEARNDRYFNSVITNAWYRELQNFMKITMAHEEPIENLPVLLHIAGADKIIDPKPSKKWLLDQGLSEFQYKEWQRLFHDIYQEPEQEEVFYYTVSFMHGVLRSLGYIIE